MLHIGLKVLQRCLKSHYKTCQIKQVSIPSASQKLSEESSCCVHWSTACWVSLLQRKWKKAIRKSTDTRLPSRQVRIVGKEVRPQRAINSSKSLGFFTFFSKAVGFFWILGWKAKGWGERRIKKQFFCCYNSAFNALTSLSIRNTFMIHPTLYFHRMSAVIQRLMQLWWLLPGLTSASGTATGAFCAWWHVLLEKSPKLLCISGGEYLTSGQPPQRLYSMMPNTWRG